MRVGHQSTSFFQRLRFVGVASLAILVIGQPNPWAQEAGSVVAADKRVQGRTYIFAETGEKIPFALFVPSNYNAVKRWPLIVGLHGAGGLYDSMMRYEGLIDMAERDGFVMVTPLGYHPFGGFGIERSGLNPPPAIAQALRTLPANISQLSEQDVMTVLANARQEFNVDPERIYLWGHSMGGSGAYHLAAKFPDMWAAVAVAAPDPAATLAQLERLKRIPILVLQGDADQARRVEQTRASVAQMKQLGMEHVYLEIKGGDHTLFVSNNRDTLSKMFSFFNIAQKSQRGLSN